MAPCGVSFLVIMRLEKGACLANKSQPQRSHSSLVLLSFRLPFSICSLISCFSAVVMCICMWMRQGSPEGAKQKNNGQNRKQNREKTQAFELVSCTSPHSLAIFLFTKLLLENFLVIYLLFWWWKKETTVFHLFQGLFCILNGGFSQNKLQSQLKRQNLVPLNKKLAKSGELSMSMCVTWLC